MSCTCKYTYTCMGGEKCQKYLFLFVRQKHIWQYILMANFPFCMLKPLCMSLPHLYVNASFVCQYFICMSFVCQYFICMSKPHLYVTTSFGCDYLICMSILHLYVTTSLGLRPSIHPRNKLMPDIWPPEKSRWRLTPGGQRSGVNLLRGRREGLWLRQVVTYKWSSDIQMK